jgi:hypothetical protein
MGILEQEFPRFVRRMPGPLPNGDEAQDMWDAYKAGYKLALQVQGNYERKFWRKPMPITKEMHDKIWKELVKMRKEDINITNKTGD